MTQKLIRSGTTVWVAVSRYAPEDDIEPLVAIGDSKEAAEEALDLVVNSHNEDETFNRDEWVDEPAGQLPVYSFQFQTK